MTHPTVSGAIGRAGSSSEYLNSLKTVAEAEGLNTTDDGDAFCLDTNYNKSLSADWMLNRGGRTHIIDWHGHEDKPPVEREDVPTLRSESHGHQPKVAQIPRGQNDGGFHRTCPTVSSNSWHENNFLKQVEPVHTPDFAEKDMNMKSRVGSEDGSMFTIDGTSQHGIMEIDRIAERWEGKQAGGVYNPNGLAPMVNYGKRGPQPHHVPEKDKRIRKLTPKECWRLQGFPDESFERAQEVNSDTQLYKQAGNAVTVNVIEALGENLVIYFEDLGKKNSEGDKE